MGPAFWAAFLAAFSEPPPPPALYVHGAGQPRDPLQGRELQVSFQVIIPTAPEGFSNARISATQTCTYAPGRGRTQQDREQIAAEELESTRNVLLEEAERVRRGLNTGTYTTTRRVGAATRRRS